MEVVSSEDCRLLPSRLCRGDSKGFEKVKNRIWLTLAMWCYLSLRKDLVSRGCLCQLIGLSPMALASHEAVGGSFNG